MIQKENLPWSQGRLLDTAQTRKWGALQRDNVSRIERHAIYYNFTDEDEGRGRVLIATCESEDMAAFIVKLKNDHDLVQETLRQALKALEEYAVVRAALALQKQGT